MQESVLLSSPLGFWRLTGSERGLGSVVLAHTDLTISWPEEIPEVLAGAVEQLNAYFAGKRKTFELKLDYDGAPPFHQAVWEELRKLPHGHTTTYRAIAEKLGDPKAVRAVGQANRHNPLAIIVPCHRCIASNGNLQGYFYGLDFKRRLLAFENPAVFAVQGKLFY